MKGLLLALTAIVAVAAIAVGAFMAGRSSMDQALYCGAYTYKWDDLNGCEMLPGFKAVPVNDNQGK